MLEMSEDFRSFLVNMIDVEPQQFHLEWADAFENKKRSAIYAPRGFGKTTTLGVWFPLWKIRFSQINGGPWEFAIISHSIPQASNIVSMIRHLLISNPLFNDLVPPQSSSLVFRERKMELTDGSIIHCRPYSKTGVGIHVDYFLFDEATKVLDDRLFWDDLASIVNHKDGNLCLIGTPDHPNDLIDQCSRNEEYYYMKYKAVNDDGTPLWPEKFPLERLEEIKRSEGLTSYFRNYLCELVASGTQVFPPKEIASVCNRSIDFSSRPPKEWLCFTGVDLAISEQGDYMVTTTIGVSTKTMKYRILDIRKTRGTDYQLQLDVVQDVARTFNPVTVLVDDSIYGSIFIQDLIHKRYVPAEPYSFAPSSRMRLLNTLVRHFSKLEIPNPPGSSETSVLTGELIRELSGFQYGKTEKGMRTYLPGTLHDDMVMSLALAVYGASQYDIYEPAGSGAEAATITGKSIDYGIDDLFSFDGSLDFDDPSLMSLSEVL